MAGIYIHFPFCKSKCIYCNFYSIASLSRKNDFIEALCNEMEIRKDYLSEAKISTLYFGGGTPSLFTMSELEKIIHHLKSSFSLQDVEEFTIEANPEQLSLEYLSQLKSLGINRLSIGIQSFDDRILTLLRRGHTAKDAITAIQNAFDVGFENISIDLIYGIAARTSEDWRQELRTALSFPITHLSAYALTVEENTLLYKKIAQGTFPENSDEKALPDYDDLITMTEGRGFEQYEISNFAKEGCYSKHNYSYWQDVPYLGLGPAAHSYNGTSRQWNPSNLNKYIEGVENNHVEVEQELLTPEMKFNEYVLLALRTSQGISLEYAERKFGQQRMAHILQIFSTIDKNHYTLQNGQLILTKEGKLFADYIAEALFL